MVTQRGTESTKFFRITEFYFCIWTFYLFATSQTFNNNNLKINKLNSSRSSPTLSSNSTLKHDNKKSSDTFWWYHVNAAMNLCKCYYAMNFPPSSASDWNSKASQHSVDFTEVCHNIKAMSRHSVRICFKLPSFLTCGFNKLLSCNRTHCPT